MNSVPFNFNDFLFALRVMKLKEYKIYDFSQSFIVKVMCACNDDSFINYKPSTIRKILLVLNIQILIYTDDSSYRVERICFPRLLYFFALIRRLYIFSISWMPGFDILKHKIFSFDRLHLIIFFDNIFKIKLRLICFFL